MEKRGEFLKATELFKEAVSITKKTGDINDMYLIMIDLGDAYRTNNKYKEALHVFDQTFEYFQKENNTKKLAKISNRKAAVYLEILFSHEAYYQIRKNGTKTPESFLDSLKSHKELNSIYNELNKWLNYSTRLSNENNYYDLVISNLNILASLKATILDYQSALKYYDLGLSKIEKFQIKEELPLLLINKARILGVRRLENIKLAIQIGEEGYKYALEQQEYIYMLLGSSVLEENYAALGNYERSYYYLKQFRILSNSLNNENLQLNLKTLELKTKIVDRELDIQKRKFKLYKTYIYSIVFFIILTTFILILGVKNRKQKLFNKELKEKTQIISDQNNKLQSLNSEKDRLFSIIGHDLRSPFNSILGFSNLIHDEYEDLTKAQIKLYSGAIIQSSNNTLELLENLLLWGKIQKNRIVFDPEYLSLERILEEVSIILQNNLIKKDLTLTNISETQTTIYADEEMLKTVFRNLIGNAIKFSHQGGKIEVSVIHLAEEDKICIMDYGVGIKKELSSQVFNMDSSYIKSDKSVEKGHGMGLIICKEIIEKHGGALWVESQEGTGSSFYFTLPREKTLS